MLALSLFRTKVSRSNLLRYATSPSASRYTYSLVRALHFSLFFGAVISLFLSGYELEKGWPLLLVSLAVAVLSQIFAVNIIGHRFIGHASFQMSRPAQFLFLLWTVLTGLASPLSSGLIHHRHHRNSDGEGDPHSPPHSSTSATVRFAVLTLLNFFHEEGFSLREVKWGASRPYFIFFHRYGAYISISFSLFVLSAFGVEALIYFQTVPVVVCALAQFNLVFTTHVPQPGNPQINRSVDSVKANLLTLGEGAHDTHHRHPRQVFYESDRLLMFDFSGYLICLFWGK